MGILSRISLFFSFCFFSSVFKQWNYGFVVDAGSSGTRIYLFKWKELTNDEKNGLQEVGESVKSFSNGKNLRLSDYGSFLPIEQLDEDFQELFQTFVSKNKISNRIVKRSSFFLGATAGLRSLSHEDSSRIIERVKSVVSRLEFLNGQTSIYILSGEEEGVFGWLQLQFLLGSLGKKTEYGILELGGSSLQHTFECENEDVLENKWPVKVGEKNYNLYTNSYFGYGADIVWKSVKEEILLSNEGKVKLSHPCLWKGVTIESDLDFGRVFVGTQDVEECERLIDNILRRNSLCLFNSCSFNGVYIPHSSRSRKYYAFSNFFWAANSIDLTVDGNVREDLTPQLFYEKSKEFLSTKRMNYSTSEFSLRNYFKGLYSSKILIDGFRFDQEGTNVKIVISVVDTNGVESSLGWEKGMLIYKVLGGESTIKSASFFEGNSFFIVYGGIGGFSILLFFMLLLFSYSKIIQYKTRKMENP